MKSIAKFFFASNPLAPAWQDLGLLVFRVFLGLALALAHGWGKIPPSEGFIGYVGSLGFPLPTLSAWLAGLAEFVGGLLVAAGLATRFGATLIILVMAGAAFVAHGGDSFRDTELAYFFLVGGIALFFTGPGRYSVDQIIRK